MSESAWNGGKVTGEYRHTLKAALDDAWQGKFTVPVVWVLDRIEGARRTCCASQGKRRRSGYFAREARKREGMR